MELHVSFASEPCRNLELIEAIVGRGNKPKLRDQGSDAQGDPSGDFRPVHVKQFPVQGHERMAQPNMKV